MIHFIGAAGIVAFVILCGWASYNRLMALDERRGSAFADVDVQLKRRHIIPGLVETVRGFAAHASAVLNAVTQARANALRATAPDTRLEAETQVGQSITSLMSVVERYPEMESMRISGVSGDGPAKRR